jgi:hypothetical protein
MQRSSFCGRTQRVCSFGYFGCIRVLGGTLVSWKMRRFTPFFLPENETFKPENMTPKTSLKTATMDNFDPITYIHRYACWTAARATQHRIKGLNGRIICSALDKSNIVRFQQIYQPFKNYALVHNQLTKNMNEEFERSGLAVGFGVLAKIIAIYFKTALIVPGLASDTILPDHLKEIYPPIDSNVLQGLEIRNINWTKMTQKEHNIVIQRMLKLYGSEIQQKGFWIMDRFFNPGA